MLKVNFIKDKTIVLLEPNGQLSKNDFINAKKIIDPSIEKYAKLRGIVIYVKDFSLWDSFEGLVSHLKFVHEHHKLVSHIVFVTNSFVGDFATNIANHFTKAKVKSFSYEKLNEAISWIKNDKYINGLFISCETTNNNFFVKFKAIGTLSHEDYEKITTVIDDILEKVAKPTIDILVDIDELESWELRAAWDDLKLGLMYGHSFNKVAIFGHNKWQDLASKIGSWFIGGEIKSFDSKNDAINWLDFNS